MAGDDVGVRVADSDIGLFEILVGEPGGPHEAAMRRAFRPRFHDIAAHDLSPDKVHFPVNCDATS
ncbi:hypothetical protein SDC9_184221 [bioreactor metagenome]|uniref:Uncharacterized protein n=1 Tax=bioreactor metagenome TaxID=1076179 RepID=A0A645HCF9_9ZZZZ